MPFESECSRALRRLRRLSATLAQVAVLIGAFLVLGYGWVWTDHALLGEAVRQVLPANVPYRLHGWTRVGLFALGLLPIAIALLGLWNARRLFLGFRKGEVFTLAAGRRLRWVGLALMLLPAMQILSVALASMLLTLGNPPGQAHLAIRMHEGHLITAFAGGLVFAVGWAMAEAARIAAENREFV